MPSDHVIFRTIARGDGEKGIQVDTPEKVIPIHSPEELESQIAHYSKLLLNLHTADNIAAHRKYVELIRPALRFFCKKYNVQAPNWLATDDYYTKTMSAQERQKLFGTRPLRIGEFQQLKKVNTDGFNYPGKPETEEEEESSDG